MQAVFVVSLTALGVAALVWPSGPATGQSIVSTGGSFVQASLIPGAEDGEGLRIAGLALDIAPGWKTYWRAPGEAGVPPVFDWSASRNLAGIDVMWPRPEVFESFGMQTVGYSGSVVLPLSVRAVDPAAPVELVGRLMLGVCKDLCVFEEAEITGSFAPGATEGADRVADALATVPVPGAHAGLTDVSCTLSGGGAERRLSADFRFDRPVGAAHVLVEAPDGAWFHGVESRGTGENSVAVEALLTLPGEGAWIARDAIRMTVLADGFAADVRGCTPG